MSLMIMFIGEFITVLAHSKGVTVRLSAQKLATTSMILPTQVIICS